METREINSGSVIVSEGESLNSIYLIKSGLVLASFEGGEITLKKGDVIGLLNTETGISSFTYTALEACTLVVIPFKNLYSVKDIIKTKPENARTFISSVINQVVALINLYFESKDNASDIYKMCFEYYDKYVELCARNGVMARSLPGLDSFCELHLDNDLPDWIPGFYSSFRDFPLELNQSIASYPGFILGLIVQAEESSETILGIINLINSYCVENLSILLDESGIDMFDLYSTLLFRLAPQSTDANMAKEKLDALIEYFKQCKNLDTNLVYERAADFFAKSNGYETAPTKADLDEAKAVSLAPSNINLGHSLDVILEYADTDSELSNAFRKLIMQYKKVEDKNSTEDVVRKLKSALTDCFYKVYSAVVRKAVEDAAPSEIIKMFINFGYVDEELAGSENAAYLYNISKNYDGVVESGIYTALEWFKAIFSKRKDPGRNEFDVDYLSNLHEMKVGNKITADQEARMANDPWGRLDFELNSMFPVVNKITFGRLSSFCPVFSAHDAIKPLPSCLVTPDTLLESLKNIKEVDYGAFYRETIYANEKAGITSEFISVEIMPDIILMPNIGLRGVMWQEIEGKKRTTPARFIISALHTEDIQTTMTRLAGEFRWEMCKRVQGSRWNDVSDRSLTSEYFDYVQFYKKNSELSPDAKEKIKQSLIKSKNSFKEMFVRDYIIWVMFEGTGSPRLNKIARQILCTYCPFPYELRQKTAANPLYKEMLERYEMKTAQKLHRFDNLLTKLKALNINPPDELLIHRNFLIGK